MRPKSIDQFAIVYGVIILAGLLSTWLSWDAMLAQVSVQQMIAAIGMGSLYGVVAFSVLIQLLLWYFIVNRGSAVAKWIFVVLTALAVLSSLWGFVRAGLVVSPVALIALLLLVLQVAAIWLIFRPDTRSWFGEDVVEP